jgi:DMSO/TMAO reductase YedYZ heme-binding membrane subunit
MQKTSLLFWLIMIGIVLLSVYESFFTTTPDVAFTRLFGIIAFFLLCVAMAIGPLTTLWPTVFGAWIEPRRAVGLSAFIFMVAHFFLVLVNRFDLDFFGVFSDFKYLIAAPTMIIFAALALTSMDVAVRTMGFGKWKTLQRLVYVGFVLTLGHFYLSQTGVIVFLGGESVFFNLAEGALWALAMLVIVLQIAGFWVTRKKKRARAEATPAAPTNEA